MLSKGSHTKGDISWGLLGGRSAFSAVVWGKV
jgi:hypothetical protein